MSKKLGLLAIFLIVLLASTQLFSYLKILTLQNKLAQIQPLLNAHIYESRSSYVYQLPNFSDAGVDLFALIDPQKEYARDLEKIGNSVYFQVNKDNKLYYGPYSLRRYDTATKKVFVLYDRIGYVGGISSNGRYLFVTENECTRNPAAEKKDDSCNAKDLRYFIRDTNTKKDIYFEIGPAERMIDEVVEWNTSGISQIIFSPDNTHLALLEQGRIKNSDEMVNNMKIIELATGKVVESMDNVKSIDGWIDAGHLIYSR